MIRHWIRRALARKLIMAFLVVGLVGVSVMGFLARWITTVEFGKLLYGQQLESFSQDAQQYYSHNGSWDGFGLWLLEKRGPLPPYSFSLPPPPAAPPSYLPAPPLSAHPLPPPPPPVPFTLLDTQGIVVHTGGPDTSYRLGQSPSAAEWRQAVALTLTHSEGKSLIGWIIPPEGPAALADQEQRFLDRTRTAIFISALGVSVVALLLGLAFTRQLTYPLRTLKDATQAMRSGDLQQQVSITSEDELGDLARSFNQMSADLAKAQQARKQMTADIAHELRTPLTVMSGYLEALRDEVLKPTPDRFATLYQEALHLQHLVEDLRTLSLADAGALPLEHTPVSLQELCKEVQVRFAHTANCQNIELTLAVDPCVPQVTLDYRRMMQVLDNLLSNALRHTSSGGNITLQAGLASLPSAETHSICIQVHDDGEGMAPDALPYMFDRFYRQDPARQPSANQSGLGLAIARSIVEAHGGAISAKSQLGQGTTITLTLPFQPQPRA